MLKHKFHHCPIEEYICLRNYDFKYAGDQITRLVTRSPGDPQNIRVEIGEERMGAERRGQKHLDLRSWLWRSMWAKKSGNVAGICKQW